MCRMRWQLWRMTGGAVLFPQRIVKCFADFARGTYHPIKYERVMGRRHGAESIYALKLFILCR